MSAKGKFSIAALLVAAFVAGVVFATSGANFLDLGDQIGTETQAAEVESTTIDREDDEEATTSMERALTLEDAFMEVSESVNPAVVQISAERVVEQRFRSPFDGTPFEDFFRDSPFGGQQEREQRRPVLGSGAIIDAEGYVVTNHHVIEDTEHIQVRMHDGERYSAEIVASDEFSDLAVLELEDNPGDLSVISFSDSGDLRVGQWVLAFGSPLSEELSHSVTSGIVSAVGRLSPGQGERSVRNYVQTDAAINPGNSGGPLVDLNGRLVGINTAIATRTGGFQGVGFAIPSNTVENVTQQLIAEGAVARGFLGVQYGPASTALIRDENLPRGTAEVAGVEDGSPADEAGLEAGDLILSVDGEELRNHLQLGEVVSSKRPGEEVTLTIDRGGERMELTATLGQMDDDAEIAANGDAPDPGEELLDELGFSITDITPDLAQQLGLEANEGVLVTDVDQGSRAFRDGGIRPQTIIVEMAGTRIENTEDFFEVYEEVDPGSSFRVILVDPRTGGQNLTSLRKPS